MSAVCCRASASAAIAFAVLAFAAPLQSAEEQKKSKAPATLRELIDAAVDDVQIFADAETTTAARPRVVLRWANNAPGSEDGTTVLYLHEGHPLAVACIYPWERQLPRDFCVLARVPLLLIESTKQGGAAKWQYAFVRRTSGELEGRHRGQVVWHAERFPETHDAQGPNFGVVSLIPPELAPGKDGR